MAGYIGSKAVNLSTTGSDIKGDQTVDGDLTVDTDTLYVDSTNNRVGVGTVTPDTALTVGQGDIKVTGSARNQKIVIERTDVGDDYEWAFIGGSVSDSQHLSITDVKAGTERLRIDASGNVGIGTATPTSLGTGITTLELKGNNAAQVDRSGGIRFERYDGTFAGSLYNADGAFTFDGGAYPMLFKQAAAERMRIDASGSVLVGTTTAVSGVTLSVQRGATSAIRTVTGTTGGVVHIQFENPNGVVGSISTSGSATAFNTSSDYRLKENILPIQGAADIVKAMQPVTYNFKADSTDWHDGFLAHELQELHPRAVVGSKDAVDEDGNPDYQGVDYSKLTPILTAALKEALDKIDALEAQNAAFETRLTALEATP